MFKTLENCGAHCPLTWVRAAGTLPSSPKHYNSLLHGTLIAAKSTLTMTSREGPASLGKVVVVGGCGFLGSHIVKYIVERHPQTQVAVLDLRTSSNRNASPTVSYHDGDITDLAAMTALFSQLRPDAVIHTASPHFNLKPEIHDKVNIGGTKNLVKAAQETGVKAFVYTSSASVILSATEPLVNADERWPIVAGDAQPEYYTTTKVRIPHAIPISRRRN
jgi:sterol-4alpha-carboxylate 3-dehydrogenase (decarboxylating)